MTDTDEPNPPTEIQSGARPPATPVGSLDFNRPTIVALLYLGSMLTGVSGLVGLVLAYVWKGEPLQPWEATHYTYLIRTFWLGLAGAVIGALTTIILIGFLLLPLVCIWVLVRSVVALMKAQQRAAIPDPYSLLI